MSSGIFTERTTLPVSLNLAVLPFCAVGGCVSTMFLVTAFIDRRSSGCELSGGTPLVSGVMSDVGDGDEEGVEATLVRSTLYVLLLGSRSC